MSEPFLSVAKSLHGKNKFILDATAGYRGIWFSKNRKDTIFIDVKREVRPTIVADFTHLPFISDLFDLVVFDPPQQAFGKDSVMGKRYGVFKFTVICAMVREAAKELWRVLKDHAILLMKWNSVREKWIFDMVKTNRILAYFNNFDALFGQRVSKRGGTRTDGRKWSSQTFWFCLIKVCQENYT